MSSTWGYNWAIVIIHPAIFLIQLNLKPMLAKKLGHLLQSTLHVTSLNLQSTCTFVIVSVHKVPIYLQLLQLGEFKGDL